MRTKIALLVAVLLLVASFAAGLKAQHGWKWHHKDAVSYGYTDGFTWDP